MFLLRWLWDGLKGLLGLFLPLLPRVRDGGGVQAWVRWTLHVLLVVAVVLLLGFLNFRLDLAQILGRAPSAFFAKLWLPSLFLLLYALAWLGWTLRYLLRAGEHLSEFPDLDFAWQEARQALERASIELTRTPLFLILGQSPGGERALFQAAKSPLTVDQVPRQPNAPMHVHATPEAIWVTCPGASLLGRQTAAYAVRGDESMGLATSSFEKERGLLDTGDRKAERQPERSLLRNVPEVELLTARLQHLCWLIHRDRRPYSPLNGILILLPWLTLSGEEQATQTGTMCRQDLTTLRRSLQVHCPVFILVCGLETMPGLTVFVDRLPEDQRSKSLGERFPFVPAAEHSAVPSVIEQGVQWLCQTMFPALVYRTLRAENSKDEDFASVVGENISLYEFVSFFREKQERLGRLLTLAVAPEGETPWLFGGCYFAATGPDPVREQAFVVGVFRRLLETQNAVAWTSEALAEEASCRLWIRLGYSGIAVFTASLVVLGYFLWRA